MSIIQISKIQQRSGNLVDLPQLDQAEFGFAADQSRLFIGKTEGNIENIEVLTSYSDISFNQIEGAIGNLNIASNVANGEVLVFDGTNWVNRGGNAGGYINLGHVSNIAIAGGGIDYVLTTDGTGNLSWTPKSTIVAFISDVTQANPGVVTCTEDIFLTNGAEVTITGVVGMTELNGNSYFIGNLTNNSFALYSDITLENEVDTTGYTAYVSGGKIVSVVGGSEGAANAAGANTEIQFNYNNLLYAVPNLTYDFGNNLLVLTGTANIGNINVANANIANTANITDLNVANTANLGDLANITITGGSSGNVLTTYGNGVLYWGAGGNGGGGNTTVGYYLHTQGSNSTTWTINHNLNTKYVSVTPIFANSVAVTGRYNYPTVTYNNNNTVTLTFTTAISGYAAIVGDSGNSAGYYTNSYSSSTTWTVDHNLNSQYVCVAPATAADLSWYGRYDGPSISYNNANSLTLTFSSAQTGNVAVIGSSNIAGYYTNSYSSSTTWTVNHNLSAKYLSVTPIYSNGVSMVGTYDFPDITYNNANSLTLTFSSAKAGNVVVVGGGGSSLPAGGSNTEVQFNNGGSLDGDPTFTFNSGTGIMSVNYVSLSVVAFANLPAATTAGRKAFVSDGNLVAAGNFGAVIGGGGSNTVPVYSDGTNWRIG